MVLRHCFLAGHSQAHGFAWVDRGDFEERSVRVVPAVAVALEEEPEVEASGPKAFAQSALLIA